MWTSAKMASRRHSYFMSTDEVLEAVFVDDDADLSDDETVNGIISYPVERLSLRKKF